MTYSLILDVFIGYALIIVVVFLMVSLIPSKTKKYRREITDMYVAGRIRQLAKKDSIDLEEEYKVFKQYYKKHRIETQALDNTIEETLQNEIIDDTNKKLNPKK